MKTSRWFACAVLLLASQATSRAGVIVSLQEVGGDVVATGSGSIDTTALTLLGNTNNSANVWAGFPLGSFAVVGGTTTVPQDVYTGITGSASFGSGDQFFATSGGGDVFGVVANIVLDLPSGYVSGTSLSATSTWAGASFSSLGLTPGSYSWTWGAGADADSFTLNIGGTAPIPEPTGLVLLATGVLGLASYGWRRKGTG
jgi:hypothetical protein